MQLVSVKIQKPDDINFILGQSHFIKTVEDIHDAMVQSVPGYHARTRPTSTCTKSDRG